VKNYSYLNRDLKLVPLEYKSILVCSVFWVLYVASFFAKMLRVYLASLVRTACPVTCKHLIAVVQHKVTCVGLN
jgi:hypothetical protein